MSKFQSAYRTFHFCETVLLHVQSIFVAFAAGRSSALLLLDLLAAFDIINLNILFHRLQYWFCFSSTALNLIASFFSD